MATKSANAQAGADLIETINGDAKATNAEQEATLQVIDEYLDNHENETNSIEWYLHVFCRSGKGDDFGYDKSHLEWAAWFFEQLIKTCMDPKVSKAFCKLNEQTPEYLSDHLTRLKTLFDDFTDNAVVAARLERLDVQRFISDHSSKELHNMRLYYKRENEVATMKQKAIDKYKGQFKI
jgi:hypothetical protein